MSGRFAVLRDLNYLRFLIGYGISFTLYWVTLLAIGWWTWEMTHSASWVGLMFFCDLAPAILVTPMASAFADKGDRFRILRTVLWIQVFVGFALGLSAWGDLLTPALLTGFVAVEGVLVGISQPAFFGLINRLVTKDNLSAAVGMNSSVIQSTYVLGPILAGFLFSFGLEIAPVAFAANAAGTLVYLWALSKIRLQPQPENTNSESGNNVLNGLTVLWKNRVIFGSVLLIIGAAILQRPLINLAPGINDYYDIFSNAYFTLLTAAFMGGGVLASLIHAARNTERGLLRLTAQVLCAAIMLYVAFFALLEIIPNTWLVAIPAFFLIGFSCGFVWTGNNIILQNRTPEHLRSRVLGNNFMLTRSIGALAVVISGITIEVYGFTNGFIGIAFFVAAMIPIMFLVNRKTASYFRPAD